MDIDLTPWIAAYGYPVTLAGAIFEGETVLVVAGLFAHRGVLDLWGLIALGAIGGVTGDVAYFALGRRYGKALLARFPKYARAADRVQAIDPAASRTVDLRHPLPVWPAHRGPRGHRQQRRLRGRGS